MKDLHKTHLRLNNAVPWAQRGCRWIASLHAGKTIRGPLAVKDDFEERAESTVLNTGVSEQPRAALGNFAFISKWVESEAVPMMGLCTHCLGVSGKNIISKVKINYTLISQLVPLPPQGERHTLCAGDRKGGRQHRHLRLSLSNKKAASSWCVSLQQLCFKQRTFFQLCVWGASCSHIITLLS